MSQDCQESAYHRERFRYKLFVSLVCSSCLSRFVLSPLSPQALGSYPLLHEDQAVVRAHALKTAALEPGRLNQPVYREQRVPCVPGDKEAGVQASVQRALLEPPAMTPAEPLVEGLARCRPNSRPKSRQSVTTCSHTETEGEGAAPSEAGFGGRGGNEGSGEEGRKTEELPM